jgi:hypothetical protein
MNEDMRNNDPNNMDFRERLKGLGKNMVPRINFAMAEMLLGYYPGLTMKELVICDMIISARWDIGNPYYNAIVGKTVEVHRELFHDKEEEVKLTIRQLCEKGVVKTILWFQTSGRTVYCDSVNCERILLHPVKLLMFTKDEVSDEGCMIISGVFESQVKEFFGPLKREES